MKQRKNFVNLKNDIKYRPPLVLFLGSGVSGELIPTWEPLLIDLIDRAVEIGLANKDKENRNKIKKMLANKDGKTQWSSYEKAGVIKRLLGSHYTRELRDCLYKGVDARYYANEQTLDEALRNTLLGSVVSLCLHNVVAAVITYNFDDLLDTAVQEKGKNVYSIYGREQLQLSTEGLPIYHVHGFLPRVGRIPSSEEALVVFSQEEYFQTMLEPFSWQTTTQLHFLRNYTCLFLGTSVTDLDMLRILSHARSYLRHGTGRTYVLTCRESIMGQKQAFDTDEDRNLPVQIWTMLMEDVGAKLVLAEENYESVRAYVNDLNVFICRTCI